MSIKGPDKRRSPGRPSKIPSLKLQIRGAILHGRFGQHDRLPSIQELAREFKVASVTAKRALDELAEEGWLESRHGVGTFVNVRRSQARVMVTAPRRRGWETFLSAENLEAFQAKHPNVQIALSSEPTTDLVVTDSYSMVADRLRGQTLQSLDELRKRLGREDWSLPDQMRALGSYKGSLYGLPMRADLLMLQVNPGLLKAANIPPPDRYLTWEQRKEILARCCQDRNDDGVVECFGAFSKLALYEWLIPFWQQGGRLDDRNTFFATEAIQVLDDLWEMHHKSRTLPLEMPLGRSETPNEIIRHRFFAQQIAMRWICSLDLFEASPFPTTVLLPRFGPVARQEVHASVMGIHRDCAHPDVAMEFLDFCYQRFIRDNPEYPFALSDEHRQFLRQAPSVHRLHQEGLSDASEPLHEGSPPRTWAIEKEIYNYLRLLQDREQMMSRLHQHWEQAGNSSTGIMASGPLVFPWSELVSPLGQIVHGE